MAPSVPQMRPHVPIHCAQNGKVVNFCSGSVTTAYEKNYGGDKNKVACPKHGSIEGVDGYYKFTVTGASRPDRGGHYDQGGSGTHPNVGCYVCSICNIKWTRSVNTNYMDVYLPSSATFPMAGRCYFITGISTCTTCGRRWENR